MTNRPFFNPPTRVSPLKGGILWAWGFSCRKNQKTKNAHKIGASHFRPQNCGWKNYGHEDFSDLRWPGSCIWPCLGRSVRAPTIEAARAIVAIRCIFDNEEGRPFPLRRGGSGPLAGPSVPLSLGNVKFIYF